MHTEPVDSAIINNEENLNDSHSHSFKPDYEFITTLIETGGIESVLVYFADVIRRANGSEDIQSYALANLFRMSQTSEHHSSKFLDELNGLKLTEFILAHPICTVSKSMLDVYLDFCLIKQDRHTSLIKSPKLVHHLLGSWRAWHKNLQVSQLLYKRLIKILQPTNLLAHSQASINFKCESNHINHNFNMMTQAGCLDTLLGILRECLCPSDGNAPKINHKIVELIVNLISLLIKHPPRLDIILDIMEFLFFLHPDPKSYVEVAQDRLSFLHPLYTNNEIEDSDEREYVQPKLLTPISETSIESYSESIYTGPEAESSRATTKTSSNSSFDNKNLLTSIENLTQQSKIDSHQRNKFIDQSKARAQSISGSRRSPTDANSGTLAPIASFDRIQQSNLRKNSPKIKYINRIRLADGYKCSNRNYAIAHIADMLASIVKLTSTFSTRILTEALQKSIIEPRKLVVLANNNAVLVREKVLRLFLSCMRACYNLNIRDLLNTYEYQQKGSTGFKNCIPLQLIGRQLVKYTTTMNMVLFCYGIIVGIDDFENVDTICLIFEIETVNNNLQLNTLILLIQLMGKLREPKEIGLTVKFVHAYVKQLLDLGEDDTLAVLIDNNLIENLMKIYFTYVEYEIFKAEVCDTQDYRLDQEEDLEDNFEETCREIDKTMVLIVRYFIQNQQTDETMRRIDDLLIYLDLLNTYVPSQYQSILRDRKVKIILTAISYCRHYEQFARHAKCGGTMEYYIKSLLKKDDLNTFPNFLSDSQLELDLIQDDYVSACYLEDADKIVNGILDIHELDSKGRGPKSQNNSNRINHDDSHYSDINKISETSVIKRFQATIEFATKLILTREAGVIPSPMERRFIMKCIKMLSYYLTEYNNLSTSNQIRDNSKPKFRWALILPKLIKSMRENFTRLILYLLSPSDSTNLDERKYYAYEILELFEVDQLLILMDEGHGKLTYKVMISFIGDLIDRDGIQVDSDDSSQLEDELLMADTEDKLMLLIRRLEQEIGAQEFDQKIRTTIGVDGSSFSKNLDVKHLHTVSKFCDIWMDSLNQIREDARDQVATLKIEIRMIDGIALDNPDDDSNRILDEALRITREVVNDKHEQRKAFLEDVKQNKVINYHMCQQWLSLINGQTHERAVWHLEGYYPKSWELNPVEGPSRVRRRLRPCKLSLDRRFFRDNKKNGSFDPVRGNLKSSACRERNNSTGSCDDNLLANGGSSLYNFHPLCSMIINHERSMDSSELRTKMFTSDKIHFNCDCNIIRPNEVCKGEVLIASRCVHFIGDLESRQTYDGVKGRENGQAEAETQATIAQDSSPFTIVEDLWFDEIVEIWDRRYQLQDVGLEIFLINNMTYLLAFRNNSDKEDFKQNLMREQRKMINLQRFDVTTSLNRLTQYWRTGRLTNFDYLTCLNKLAGRSFNDLMQYPIFPFILSNYTGSKLDLNKASNYRDLKKPMAIQNPDKEVIFLNNYQDSQSSNLSVGLCGMRKPYHYGNHYSNSATVLHFLVRLPPFTQMLIQYQDNNFDQPDRTFHSIASTWQSITRDSNTDFKELIPEFFYLPEMFRNAEQFELGLKQNNELVDDVKLPLWCPNDDARLFTLIHRQALESSHVSEHLHHWIDLIFGYKQTGKAAIEAINVFHPATYYGMVDLGDEQGGDGSTSSLSSHPLTPTIASLSKTKNGFPKKSPHLNVPRANNWNRFNSGTATIANSWPYKSPVQPDEVEPIGRRPQADIERQALATMIRTYGQMPRQLFTQPMQQRNSYTYTQRQAPIKQQPITTIMDEQTYYDQQEDAKPEPLKQIKGLKWGSYVGSPDENEITAIRLKKIVMSESITNGKSLSSSPGLNSEFSNTLSSTSSSYRGGWSGIRGSSFNLCILPNGDVAILRGSASLMLNHCSVGRNFGTGTAKYSRRIGLSSGIKMNSFLNMILSRQQCNHVDEQLSTTHKHLSQSFESTNSAKASSSLASLATTKAKLISNSLSLVSWSHIDGAIRIRIPAFQVQKPSLPLVKPNSIMDRMSTCASVPELNLLLVGYTSGSICAHVVSASYPMANFNLPSSHNESSKSPAMSENGLSSSSSTAEHMSLNTTSVTTSGSLRPSGILQRATNNLNLKSSDDNNSKMLSEKSHLPSGRVLQVDSSLNKTTRWLYCHKRRINCLKINVSFGILVTGSEDGTSVIWDLNNLTYVKTIDYKLQSLDRKQKAAILKTPAGGIKNNQRKRKFSTNDRTPPLSPRLGHSWQDQYKEMSGSQQNSGVLDYLCSCDMQSSSQVTSDANAQNKQHNQESELNNGNNGRNDFFGSQETIVQGCICDSGVSLIAISDTLGDIVTIKDMSNRLAGANEDCDDSSSIACTSNYTSCNNMFTASSDSTKSDNHLSSILYCHTINGYLVGIVNCHSQVTAVCYSNAPEGISVNVIVVGLADGLIRLYNSWDLSRVKEFHVSGLNSPITSLLYSRDNQLLYAIYDDGQLVVLRNKRKGSIALPKEWYL